MLMSPSSSENLKEKNDGSYSPTSWATCSSQSSIDEFKLNDSTHSSSLSITRKVVMLGDSRCGKTSLLERFTTEVFQNTNYPTMETTRKVLLKWRTRNIHLEIVDTLSILLEKSLSRNSCIGADGFLLCFSLGSLSSLEKLSHFNHLLYEFFGSPPYLPRILVGMMSDLDSDHKKVTEKDIKAMQEKLQIPHYVECSSRLGSNVDKVFDQILDHIEYYNNEYCYQSPSPIITSTHSQSQSSKMVSCLMM